MCRRSSPTEYWRWSANSTDEPRRLLLRSPFIRPTKIFLLTSSSCSSLWRNSGSSRGGLVEVAGMGTPGALRDSSRQEVGHPEQSTHEGGGDAQPDDPGDQRREED